MASRQLLVFKLNNEDFGVDISQVDSIISPKEIVKIPNTPEFIEGLLSLRGKVYTIFNLRKKFNLPHLDFNESTKIVIVNINAIMVGFIADEVNEIIRVEDENIASNAQAIASLNRKYLSGVAKIGEDKIVLVLDLDQTLSVVDEDAPVKTKAK